jgi:hypothetical protein
MMYNFNYIIIKKRSSTLRGWFSKSLEYFNNSAYSYCTIHFVKMNASWGRISCGYASNSSWKKS